MPELDALAKPRPGVMLTDPVTLVEHGEIIVAVFFAAVDGPKRHPGAPDPDPALLEEADRRLRDNFGGRFFARPDRAGGPGSTGCDAGAADALKAAGMTEPYWHISRYFASDADARAFAMALDPPALAVAQVTIFCAD